MGLQIVQSSAKTTAFAMERIPGFQGLSLWIDGNSKITAGNGTFENPGANALSTVQVKDCPGSTPICRSTCYVHQLEKARDDIHKRYRDNSTTLRRILNGSAGNSLDWAELVAAWITENASGGFRWHVSGDVFSREHAHWIVQVCRRSPNVQHWIYTRSFSWVDILTQVPNLAVNLSADKDNESRARAVANKHKLRVCYMATSAEDLPSQAKPGDVLFPDYSLRHNMAWLNSLPRDVRRGICPVDMVGKSRSIRCGVCKKCLKPSPRR